MNIDSKLYRQHSHTISLLLAMSARISFRYLKVYLKYYEQLLYSWVSSPTITLIISHKCLFVCTPMLIVTLIAVCYYQSCRKSSPYTWTSLCGRFCFIENIYDHHCHFVLLCYVYSETPHCSTACPLDHITTGNW